jgi:hypothetical protein
LRDYREVASASSDAAYVALSEDRLPEAISLLDTTLQATDRIDDPRGTMIIHRNVGLAHLFAGDIEHAREAFHRQLRLCAQYAFRDGADLEGLAGLAAVAAAQGRDEVAARLLGAAHAIGYPPSLSTFIDRIDGTPDQRLALIRREEEFEAVCGLQFGHELGRAASAPAARGFPSLLPRQLGNE